MAYINRRLEVVQAYCANILFYIRLRAKASQALQDHPVIGRLAQFKSILNKITSEKTQDYLVLKILFHVKGQTIFIFLSIIFTGIFHKI